MSSRFSALVDSRSRAILIAILLVAVVVRLAFWFAVVGLDTEGGGDEPDYHRLAADISEGRGFLTRRGEPTAERPPLYPAVLGGLYVLTGPDPDAGRALQVALGALIVLLVYILAGRLFSKKIALLAAALAAVNPGLVYLSALLMTENLYVVLLLLMLIALAGRNEEVPASIARFAGAGVLAGLCALARPTGFTIAILIAGGTLAFANGRPAQRLAKSGVLLLLAIVVVLPWSVRNHARLDRWVLFTTHAGITFYESNCMLNYDMPEFRGIVVLPRSAVPGWDELDALPEAESDELAWRLGIEFIREHPREFAAMAWWKFARFWRVESGLNFDGAAGLSGGGLVKDTISKVDVLALYWIVVIPLFCLGLVTTARKYRKLLPLYCVIAAHVLLAIAFHGSMRARMPIEPIMTIVAAAAAGWLVSTAGRRAFDRRNAA